MPKIPHLATSAALLVITLLSSTVNAQKESSTPDAPIPAQILSAQKIFIANGGEEYNHSRGQSPFEDTPNHTYNRFYAAMKAWGRYSLASTPADADLVFEISMRDSSDPSLISRLALKIRDSKTQTTLWPITRYIEPAGLLKNREKNYDLAMTALVNDLQVLVTPPAAPTQK